MVVNRKLMAYVRYVVLYTIIMILSLRKEGPWAVHLTTIDSTLATLVIHSCYPRKWWHHS